MAIMRTSVAVKNAALQSIATLIDAGTGPGYMEFYTAPMPATVATAVSTQTKLGTLTFADPCGAVASGVLTFSPITRDDSADVSGAAAWVRCFDSAGVAHTDLDVTVTGGGGSVQLNAVDIVAGGPIEISAMTIGVAA